MLWKINELKQMEDEEDDIDELCDELQEYALDLGSVMSSGTLVMYATSTYKKELELFETSDCDVCVLQGQGVNLRTNTVFQRGFIYVDEYAVKEKSRAKLLEAMLLSYSALKNGGNQYIYSLPFTWLHPAYNLKVCSFSESVL